MSVNPVKVESDWNLWGGVVLNELLWGALRRLYHFPSKVDVADIFLLQETEIGSFEKVSFVDWLILELL